MLVDVLDFTVLGVPAPQGSMRAIMPKGASRPILKGDNERTQPWRQAVGWVALTERNRQGFELIKRPGAVRMELGFFFERPERAKSSLKTTKPDIDKLQRAALDALTGVLFEDDSQVVSVICTKDFGSPARMMARVWTVG